MSKKTTEQQAADAQKTADDLQAKADAQEVTPEQKKADAAAQKADDLAAKAQEEQGSDERTADETLAGEVAVIDPEVPAGDHEAQVFGNNPLNPALAPGLDPEVKTVRMVNDKPNGSQAFADVHPEMVGDYARAGWRLTE
ncbi:hypothetical protein [Pseudomonas sp. SLFW]|uniref:hypothetical protein n=1 Tax=Pseudomonas sp. SLFW TaxID=2683259 RepID=UPI001412874E|nr:hypothetical protein [Pseudomonas sp. SLFW]NBB11816.1 hypothetical protein [Pseudomonas sp. SLFW]